jgi:hypothetical protein
MSEFDLGDYVGALEYLVRAAHQFAGIEVHEPAETARRNAARMAERAISEAYATAGSDPLGAH